MYFQDQQSTCRCWAARTGRSSSRICRLLVLVSNRLKYARALTGVPRLVSLSLAIPHVELRPPSLFKLVLTFGNDDVAKTAGYRLAVRAGL